MSRALIVHQAGPGVTVQDMGRPGFLSLGLSRGGAADRLALFEGAALLRQPASCAALEMAGVGGTFEASADMRIALTGAPMRATLDGTPLVWNASHAMPAGARLTIGGALRGSYGYLHVGGGLDTPQILGGRGAHLAAGIGGPVTADTHLPLGADSHPRLTGLFLPDDDRFDGGTLRAVHSLQTALFDDAALARFQTTAFTRDARGNRMGVRLNPEGAGFQNRAGLSVLSEVITPGDIQITGDGTPFVLLTECQTTGGYPRIGAILPSDLPRVAQARPGAALSFRFVTDAQAREIETRAATARSALQSQCRPLLRDPRDIPDLLAYDLIGGMTAGDDLERDLP